jgi:hypothetical protein
MVRVVRLIPRSVTDTRLLEIADRRCSAIPVHGLDGDPSSRSNRRGDGTSRNMQVSAVATSVGVRGALPMSGWVVTQLVTQYA